MSVGLGPYLSDSLTNAPVHLIGFFEKGQEPGHLKQPAQQLPVNWFFEVLEKGRPFSRRLGVESYALSSQESALQ